MYLQQTTVAIKRFALIFWTLYHTSSAVAAGRLFSGSFWQVIYNTFHENFFFLWRLEEKSDKRSAISGYHAISSSFYVNKLKRKKFWNESRFGKTCMNTRKMIEPSKYRFNQVSWYREGPKIVFQSIDISYTVHSGVKLLIRNKLHRR